MLQTLKINAISAVVNNESGKVAYAMNLNYEGAELTLWRTAKQFASDCDRSGLGKDLSALEVKDLINGTVQAEVIKVNAGDKYHVDTTDEDGVTSTEERTYDKDSLQVLDGFLSIDMSLNARIAAAVADKFSM